MSTYTTSAITTKVRSLMDENASSSTLSDLEDIGTLSLDTIILNNIAVAARIIEERAPRHLLDSGESFESSITVYWKNIEGYGCGYVFLPDDFMRLVTFMMSDWSKPITVLIDEDSPLYYQQQSPYAGVKGTPENPIGAFVKQAAGDVLEFYSCTGGSGVTVKRARYLPIPTVSDDTIEICDKLYDAVVAYTAYLSAQTIGDEGRAAALMTLALQLAQIDVQQ